MTGDSSIGKNQMYCAVIYVLIIASGKKRQIMLL